MSCPFRPLEKRNKNIKVSKIENYKKRLGHGTI